MRLDSSLVITPYFARRWSWSADRRALTVFTSPALRWHDGEPTTARDVAFTLARASGDAVGSPRASDLRVITHVDAPDDTTLQLRFASPQRTVPLVLAELPIMPRHRWNALADSSWRSAVASERSVGNGPFRFVRRVRGESWLFARNADFPSTLGGPPVLSQLVVTVVDEPSTKVAGLVSGALDMAGVSPTMATLVERDATLRLASPPVLFSTILVMNPGRAPLDDPAVRRSLSRAIHRRRIIDAALNGFGVPAGSVVPPGLPFAPGAVPRESMIEAAALLDQAGWTLDARGVRRKNGRALELELWTVGSGDLALEQLVQADLAAIGVRVQLRAQEFTSLLAALRAPLAERRFDLAVTGISGDIGLSHLEALLHSRQAGGALDLGKLHERAIDVAVDRARASDDSDRERNWAAVDSVLDISMPVVWLYHSRGVQGVARRLEHGHFDLRGELANVSQWSVTAR
jgi:peptide/nickel transport system substrate-binding protein